MEAAKLVEEQQMIQQRHFEGNIILVLKKCKNEAAKLFYICYTIKSSFTHLKIKSKSVNESNLSFSEENLLEKYEMETKTTEGVYYPSDLGYSKKREGDLVSLKRINTKVW